MLSGQSVCSRQEATRAQLSRPRGPSLWSGPCWCPLNPGPSLSLPTCWVVQGVLSLPESRSHVSTGWGLVTSGTSFPFYFFLEPTLTGVWRDGGRGLRGTHLAALKSESSNSVLLFPLLSWVPWAFPPQWTWPLPPPPRPLRCRHSGLVLQAWAVVPAAPSTAGAQAGAGVSPRMAASAGGPQAGCDPHPHLSGTRCPPSDCHATETGGVR